MTTFSSLPFPCFSVAVNEDLLFRDEMSGFISTTFRPFFNIILEILESYKNSQTDISIREFMESNYPDKFTILDTIVLPYYTIFDTRYSKTFINQILNHLLINKEHYKSLKPNKPVV